MKAAFRTSHSQRARRILYTTLFMLLVFGAGLAAWTNSNAAAPTGSVPTGSTIPPAGTIPPPPPPGPNEGQVNILHVAPFDADLINTGIQICDADGNTVSDYLYYQQQTGYVTLPMGIYDWYIGPAGDDCQTMVLDIPVFNLGAGGQLLLIIFGDGDNQPLDVMLFVERAGQFVYYLPHMLKD